MSDNEDSASSIEEKTITFRVRKTVCYDGLGHKEAHCQGCRGQFNRFFILHLENGGYGILCFECIESELASDCGNAWTPSDEE